MEISHESNTSKNIENISLTSVFFINVIQEAKNEQERQKLAAIQAQLKKEAQKAAETALYAKVEAEEGFYQMLICKVF